VTCAHCEGLDPTTLAAVFCTCREIDTGAHHTRDEDCTLDADEFCTACGVSHCETCPDCGGRGFHRDGCPEL
jgi:hypothetical protein